MCVSLLSLTVKTHVTVKYVNLLPDANNLSVDKYYGREIQFMIVSLPLYHLWKISMEVYLN